jgi:hypothetical protein
VRVYRTVIDGGVFDKVVLITGEYGLVLQSLHGTYVLLSGEGPSGGLLSVRQTLRRPVFWGKQFKNWQDLHIIPGWLVRERNYG